MKVFAERCKRRQVLPLVSRLCCINTFLLSSPLQDSAIKLVCWGPSYHDCHGYHGIIMAGSYLNNQKIRAKIYGLYHSVLKSLYPSWLVTA